MSESGTAGDRPELFIAAGDAACAVKLPAFEGPLDLLLHLIRLNEVDVTDIPIALIAEQYLEYVVLMRDLNLDVAGEYLVMAATLAWIKSRMLLPATQDEEDEEGVDPRAELVARLLEYQRFKEAAGELEERPLLGRDVFAPIPPAPEPTPEGEREIEVGLLALLDAFRRVVRTARAASAAHEVETESITVRDCMLRMMAVLERANTLSFEELLTEPGRPTPGRAVLVASFLALLELARLGALRLYQSLDANGTPEGPIRARCVPSDSPGEAWTTRIAETM